jgi:hypothetical protein
VTQYEFLVASVESHTGDGCLDWEYGTDRGGYGKVWDGRKHRRAHVVALELTTPRPIGKVCSIKGKWVPGKKLQAAHGPCHNTGCFNPAHLSWKTSAENIADKKRDGTHQAGESHPSSTIPSEVVDAMKAEWKGPQKPGPKTGSSTGPSQRELARKYGLSQGHVGRILRGEYRSAA